MSSQKSSFSRKSFKQAVTWFVALQSEHSDKRQSARFQRWLDSDPSHPLAYAEAEKLWANFDSLKTTDVPELAVARSASAQSVPLKSLSILLLCSVLTGWWLDYRVKPQLYQTDVGQQLAFSFTDGSSIQLNVNSRISVRLSWCRRQIQLLEGEALFNVAHESFRPFIANAMGLRVRDIGTRFLLSRRFDKVRVSVLEGEVALKTNRSWMEQSLTTGQGRELDRFGRLQKLSDDSVEAEVAWTEGRLVFNRAPLSEIVTTLERHHNVRFILSDTALGQQTLSGSFEIRDLEPFLRAVRVTLPVKVVRKQDTIFFSRSR